MKKYIVRGAVCLAVIAFVLTVGYLDSKLFPSIFSQYIRYIDCLFNGAATVMLAGIGFMIIDAIFEKIKNIIRHIRSNRKED